MGKSSQAKAAQPPDQEKRFTQAAIVDHAQQLADGFKLLPGLLSGSEDLRISALIQASKVDLSCPLPPPDICLSILDGPKDFVLFTLGNFSAITGRAKSKKTFLAVILAAAAAGRVPLYDKFRNYLPDGREHVIFFDTEQSRHKAQQTGRRIYTLSGTSSTDSLEVYSLRSFPPDDRIKVIEGVLYQKGGSAGLVVIDGIRDLVFDINDPTQATDIVTKLLKWTEDLNIHIVTVIHQNKGDTNARGHLGTEIVNKAEVVISVTKSTVNSEVSVCEPEFCRELEFPGFGFSVGADGLPYLTDMPEPRASPKSRKAITPNSVDEPTHRKILSKIFTGGKSLGYTPLVKQVKLGLQELYGSVGVNKSKCFITHYIKQGWLVKNGGDRSQTTVYNLVV